MALIQTALYKELKGQPLTRREQKALKQHHADPNTRHGVSSYKGNTTVECKLVYAPNGHCFVVSEDWEPRNQPANILCKKCGNILPIQHVC